MHSCAHSEGEIYGGIGVANMVAVVVFISL